MLAFSSIGSTLLYAIGWALIHSLWQGILIALVAGVIFHRLRVRGDENGSSQVYRVALGSLALLFCVVCVTALVEYSSAKPIVSIRTASTGSSTQELRSSPSVSSSLQQTESVTQNISENSLPTLLQRLQSVQEAWQTFINEHIDFMVALWFSGVMIFIGKLFLSTWYVRRLRTEGVQPLPEVWQRTVQSIAEKIALSTTVDVVESTLARVPMTIGILKPMILFPVGMIAGLTPQQVEAILAHEMAHILRRDFAVNIVQSIVESILFYHPAVWWLSGIINQEREHCCDDIALSVTGDSRAIATALSALVQYSSLINPLSSSQFFPGKGGKNMLLHRIQRLLQSPIETPRLHSGYFSAALALTIALMLVLGTNTEVQELVAKTSTVVKDAVVETIAEPIGLTAERDKHKTKKDSVERDDYTMSYGDHVVFSNRTQDRLDPHAEPAGEWAAELRDDDRVTLRLNEPNDGIGYHIYNRYPLDKFQGLTAQSFAKEGEINCTISLELGTLSMKGTMNARGKAKGTYRFTADAKAVAELKAMGYNPVTDMLLYDVALAGTKLSTFEAFKGLNLSLSHVASFVLTGVKPSYVKDALAQGMKADDIQAFGVVGVSPAVATSFMSQGFTRNEAVEFGVRGLRPASVKEYKDAGFSTDEAKELGVRGIEPVTAKDLKAAGFKGHEVYELGVRGITPKTAQAYKELGFATDDAMEFAVRGIKPETAKKLRDAGVPDEEAMEIAVRGISPEKAKEYKAAGFAHRDMLEYAVRGIKPETAKKFRSAGFSDRDAMELAVRGIDPERAKVYQAQGFDVHSAMEYGVRGIKPETAKAYKEQGFSTDETMDLAVRGIRPDYASQLRKMGLQSDDIAQIGVRGVSIEWVREAKAMGFSSDEISEIGVRGISIKKLKKLKDEGLSTKKIVDILTDW